MKSLASWLLIMFMGIFWVFRVIVTLATQFGGDFGGFIVINNVVEILMLFLSLLCFVLIFKGIIWGAVIYLMGYGWYFGKYLIDNFIPALTSGEQIDMIILENSVIGLMAIILGIIAILNIAYERTKLKHFSDNKTDWYFNNDKYDREKDERADKNQYRTL